MTEVQKYAGAFLERQRLAKLNAKKNQKEGKEDKKKKKVESEDEKDDTPHEGDGLSEKQKDKFRKFLESGCEFKGLEKTVMDVLKKEDSREMKLKSLAKQITQIYKLSEDFDSESEDEDDGWLADRKKVAKKMKKLESERLEIEGKMIKLVAAK